VPPCGPKDAKIVIIGEAPGEHEERHGLPFCGTSGEELGKMMKEAGLEKAKCYQTLVFKHRPPEGKIERWCGGKKDVGADYRAPPLSPGKYVLPQYLGVLDELWAEMAGLQPNLLLLVGGAATWAFGLGSITKVRGVVTPTRFGKSLAIFSPGAVLRNWSTRPVVVADLLKAKHESGFPDLRRPRRTLWINPTLLEVLEFSNSFLEPARQVSFDIETKAGTITCVSLAPSAHHSLCIPLWDPKSPTKSYWSVEDEVAIWKVLHRHLVHRPMMGETRLLAQNGLYDIQYLADYGLRVPRLADDTMLMHHALYPEMKKGLGFLASVYTNELSWKNMVKDFGRDK